MSDPKKPIEGEIVPPDATTPVDDKTTASASGRSNAGPQTPGAGTASQNDDDERMPGAGGEGLSDAQKRKLGRNKIWSGAWGTLGAAAVGVAITYKLVRRGIGIALAPKTWGIIALAGTLPLLTAAVTEGIEELNNPHGNLVSFGLDTLNQSKKNYAWTGKKLDQATQFGGSVVSASWAVATAPWKAGASLGSGTQQATRIATGITAERIVYCEPVLPAYAGIYRALSLNEQVEILQQLRDKFNADIDKSGTPANNVLYDKKFPVIRGIVEGRQGEVIKLDVIHADSLAAQNCTAHQYRAITVPDNRKLPRATQMDLK